VRLKQPLATLLALFLAVPAQAAPLAVVAGSVVSPSGAPLAAAELVLVNLDNGRLTSTATDGRGGFRAHVEPGVYSLVPRQGRLVSGTRVVAVVAGQTREAALTVETLAPAPAPASPGVRAEHAPVGCMMADEFVEISASLTPAPLVESARVYFKSSWEQEYHYVEMAPDIGRHVACIPRPQREASPISYYIEASGKDGTLVRTPEASALVVGTAAECPADRRVAVLCPCDLPVAVYGPGQAAAVPAGFSGALGGFPGALVTGTTAALAVIGASAIGIMVIMRTQPTASPSR
jgi:hypothetical protein